MKKISTKKTFYFLLLFTTTFFLQSCDLFDDDNDAPPQLPEATQTGKNTFGCMINGEPFVVTNTSKIVAIYQNNSLFIGGQKNIDKNLFHINIFISETVIGNQIKANNSYILNSNKVQKGEYYTELEGRFYTTSPDYTGVIEITNFDKTKFIISGTFYFNSISEDSSDSVNITNGRFDLKYIP